MLRWYDRNGRQLPWRESRDPYRIWVSEIMLQQTTVAAVVPYFDRFLKHFPSVEALANAEQSQVLRLWEGLGYYSRARNLHKAAVVVVNDLCGNFPQSVAELKQLPGVGPYTAAAIASFAFGEPAGIVEANTLRLYSRLIELDNDPRSTRGQKTLWNFADGIVSPGRSADFNQAVMDIGSQICRPAEPDCHDCPLTACCRAFATGRQHEIPPEKRRAQITDVTEVAIAICKRNRFLMRQRSEEERWAGLWDFVRFEIAEDTAESIRLPPKPGRAVANSEHRQRSLFEHETESRPERTLLPVDISQKVADLTGLQVSLYDPCVEIRHAVTRYRIRLLCLICDVDAGRVRRTSGYRWCTRQDLADLPLSTTGRRFADHLTGAENQT